MEASSSWVIHPSGDQVRGLPCVRAWVRGRVVLLVVLGGAVHSFEESQCLSFQAGFSGCACSECS